MSRFHNRNFELLEPYDAKVSCTVLRGGSIRKDADLLDTGILFGMFVIDCLILSGIIKIQSAPECRNP